MASLYYNGAVDTAWENPSNWWLDNAATIPALNAPWVNGVDTVYLGYDLTYATGANTPSQIGVDIGTGATGTCDINYIQNNAYVYGGTFSGGFSNNGTIDGGTFSGAGFSNYFGGLIIGGTFSGVGFSNSGGFIIGGTFSGAGFSNSGTISNINGGTFSGVGFTNSGTIYGGTFSGAMFNNYYIIDGGTFSGAGFNNYYGGLIIGGTFLPHAISVTTSGSNTLLAMSGGVTFGYPTPPSGGSDQTVARLLDLPWFINL